VLISADCKRGVTVGGGGAGEVSAAGESDCSLQESDTCVCVLLIAEVSRGSR